MSANKVWKHTIENEFKHPNELESLRSFVASQLLLEPNDETVTEKTLQLARLIESHLESEFGGQWHCPINGAPIKQFIDLYTDGSSTSRRPRRDQNEAVRESFVKSLQEVLDLPYGSLLVQLL